MKQEKLSDTGGTMDVEAHEADLLQALTELAGFLNRYGEDEWATYFRQCRDGLGYLIQENASRSERASVAARIRSVYGGMGSFRDLVIHPLNRHPVEEGAVSEVNQTLYELAGKVYDLSWLYQEAQNGPVR